MRRDLCRSARCSPGLKPRATQGKSSGLQSAADQSRRDFLCVARGFSPGRAVVAALAAALVPALAASPARADPPPAPKPGPATEPPDERRDTYSPYERASIDEAVRRVHGVVERRPEGKILEGVDIVTLDVFERRDPIPNVLLRFVNWFHVTTKKYVIEREVLLNPGERYSQALVDETARNLRGFSQLSLVLCVPLEGSAPGRVRLLVITKDVWSLRLNNSFTYEDGRLQYLLLQPAEINLAGTHQEILGNFVLDPATIQVGGAYVIPRLAGSHIAASISANAILNRDTGHAEGTSGAFTYQQPLWSTLAEWAWGGSMSWDYEISRRFIGGLFTDFDPSKDQCVTATVQSGTAADPKRCEYRTDALAGSYAVTRSWGSAFKHDLSVGVSANRRIYTTNDLSVFSPAEQVAFDQALVPVSDVAIGPYVEYHDYSSRFVDVLDVETLGLTENFRRGHEILLHVAPITTAFNSSRNYVNVFASAAYTVPIGDGLVGGVVQSNVEVTTGAPAASVAKNPGAGDRIPDGSIEAGLHITTPRFKIGRLVFDADFVDRYKDYLNTQSSLGGDTRLRGYPSGSFVGQNFVAANLEYRSRPFELFSVQLGGALFFDAGDAFNEFSQIRLKQGAGFGLRVLFPQLERTVMRIDWGFPLTKGVLPPQSFPGDIVVTFGQAFDPPTVPTGN
jgi:hypothetical protein